MKALGTFVNSLIDNKTAHVSETHHSAVTVDGLSLEDAEQLRMHIVAAGLLPRITDAVEDMLDGNRPVVGTEPISISFSKPQQADEIFFASTRAFGQWLMAPTATAIVRVATCTAEFKTEAFLVAAPEIATATRETRARKSPRRIVRDATSKRLVPSNIGPYLLLEGSPTPEGQPVFEEWLARAASCIALCLANEVQHDRKLEFLGPPRLTLDWIDPDATPALVDWFEPMHETARWVYDIDREVELRHRLFTQEFARLAFGQDDLSTAALKSAESALEGARIAYAFHLQEISKDALKSLSDLRKAVSEETQKLFEATRQLGLSAAGALFYAVGLVGAKLSTSLSTLLFGAMLVLGMSYIGLIVTVNYRAVKHQKDLRSVWRLKVYRYLTDEEFKVLVEEPTERAERLLFVTLWAVAILAALVFVSAFLTYGYENSPSGSK